MRKTAVPVAVTILMCCVLLCIHTGAVRFGLSKDRSVRLEVPSEKTQAVAGCFNCNNITYCAGYVYAVHASDATGLSLYRINLENGEKELVERAIFTIDMTSDGMMYYTSCGDGRRSESLNDKMPEYGYELNMYTGEKRQLNAPVLQVEEYNDSKFGMEMICIDGEYESVLCTIDDSGVFIPEAKCNGVYTLSCVYKDYAYVRSMNNLEKISRISLENGKIEPVSTYGKIVGIVDDMLYSIYAVSDGDGGIDNIICQYDIKARAAHTLVRSKAELNIIDITPEKLLIEVRERGLVNYYVYDVEKNTSERFGEENVVIMRAEDGKIYYTTMGRGDIGGGSYRYKDLYRVGIDGDSPELLYEGELDCTSIYGGTLVIGKINPITSEWMFKKADKEL